MIAGALWRGRRLDIRYREGAAVVSRRLDPLGLVLKAGVWYLLAQRRGEERVYRVSRIVSAKERDEPSTRAPDFDLAAAWASRSEAFERSRTQIEVTVRVPRSQVRYLRGARVVEDGERPTVIARFDGLDHAFHSLLAYGATVPRCSLPDAARADRSRGRRDRGALRDRRLVGRRAHVMGLRRLGPRRGGAPGRGCGNGHRRQREGRLERHLDRATPAAFVVTTPAIEFVPSPVAFHTARVNVVFGGSPPMLYDDGGSAVAAFRLLPCVSSPTIVSSPAGPAYAASSCSGWS